MSPTTYEGYGDNDITCDIPAPCPFFDSIRWPKSGRPDLFRIVDIDCALIPPDDDADRRGIKKRD